MSFLPIIPALLVAVLTAAVLAVAVMAFVRARGTTARAVWAGRMLLVVLCGAMLLRPGIPDGQVTTVATQTDIVLAVDTTASIVAEDWDGDRPRIEGVRGDIAALLDAYPGARFALVTFDASAQVRLPLTTDTTAVMTAVEVLRPEATAQSRGSSIGVAADTVADLLAGAADRSQDRTRMVFYFGDGEQTASDDPESFDASAALVAGGAVFGYGTEAGGPMRTTAVGGDPAGEYIEYQGAPALSTIDDAALQTIADELGVDYQRRDAATEPDYPPAPTQTVTASGTAATRTELTWMLAVPVLVLLGVEIALATRRFVQAGGITRAGRRP